MLFWKRLIGQNRQRKLFESGQAKDTLKQVNLNSELEISGVSSILIPHNFLKLFSLVKVLISGKRSGRWVQR